MLKLALNKSMHVSDNEQDINKLRLERNAIVPVEKNRPCYCIFVILVIGQELIIPPISNNNVQRDSSLRISQ